MREPKGHGCAGATAETPGSRTSTPEREPGAEAAYRGDFDPSERDTFVISVEAVRVLYYQRSGEDRDSKRDTLKHRFRRDLTALQAIGRVGVFDGFVWERR